MANASLYTLERVDNQGFFFSRNSRSINMADTLFASCDSNSHTPTRIFWLSTASQRRFSNTWPMPRSVVVKTHQCLKANFSAMYSQQMPLQSLWTNKVSAFYLHEFETYVLSWEWAGCKSRSIFVLPVLTSSFFKRPMKKKCGLASLALIFRGRLCFGYTQELTIRFSKSV